MTEPEDGIIENPAEAREFRDSTYARQFVAGKHLSADPWAGIADEHGSPDLDKLIAAMPEAVLRAGADGAGDPVASVDPAKVTDVLVFLRDECGFLQLTDLTAADYPDEDDRFIVIYILTRFSDGVSIRLKAALPEEAPEIDTAVDVFACANWLEREVWDMYGVRFRNHPDMTRILMPEDYPHHPLRKEFPVTGDIVMRD